MNNDEEDKWHYTDYFVPGDELEAEAPAPSWLARFWPALVAVLAIGIMVTVWIWQARSSGGDYLPGQASDKDIGLIDAQLREFLSPKQIGEDPTQRQMPAELLGKAKMLLAQGNDEQNALAKIALKNDNGADLTIRALKREPIAQAFRLLTLEGHNWYNVGEFDLAVKFYEQALVLQPEDADALRNAAIAHNQAKQGDMTAHQQRALELLRHAVEQAAAASAQWCELQNNLGLAWTESLSGDRDDNLRQAIAAFRSAQGSLACDGNPAFRGKLQNNMGAAWLKMSAGDQAGNLHNAIAAFRLALEAYTSQEHPLEWAMVQNNLGKALIALADLHVGDVGESLTQAAAGLRSALEVLVREEHPLEWADVQNNLGLALDRLPTGELNENRRKAIAAFQAAEKAYSRTIHPMEWASTRFNQAMALKHLADTATKGCDHLWQSMAYLKAAASVWTPEAFPVSHQSHVAPLTQAVREAWHIRDCGTEKTLDGIPAAR
jgi:tetratricopeptide (TPR) repeat protein